MKQPELEELQAVEILWLDAHGGAFDRADWTKIDRKHTTPEEIRTVGLLVSHSDEGATVCLSYTSRQHSDAYIFIPEGCITEFNYLEERE